MPARRLTMGLRLVWLGVAMLVLLGSLGGRLYYLQVVQAGSAARTVNAQRLKVLPIMAERGQILDRRGAALSDPKLSWGVAAFGIFIDDPAGTARRLADVLGLDEASLEARIRQAADPFWVVWGVDRAVAELVRRMDLPGVVASPVISRYGPQAAAHHLAGYYNREGGQMGLEQLYELDLTGTDEQRANDQRKVTAVPSLVAFLDGHQKPLEGLGIRAMVPGGKRLRHVHTTLDVRTQRAVESVLKELTHPEGGPWRGAVVVMEPGSGEVLAMASRPDFDQAEWSPADGGDALINRAVTAFEPGSVFKPLVAAAALQAGLVQLEEQVDCPAVYPVGEQLFLNAGGVNYGRVPFREALARSCNTTFAAIGYERLGAERLLTAARAFGLGRPTLSIGLPGEAQGRLPSLQFGGEVAQFSFGQAGLMVTPLQVARAYSAIANGGILPQVRLVTAIKNDSGRVLERPESDPDLKPHRIMTEETARALRLALLDVTRPDGVGTGKAAWVGTETGHGAGSAGKTGSAEGTDGGRPAVHAWFAGFLPLREPRYVVVVFVQGGGGGGTAAAPVFRQIGEALLELEGQTRRD